MLAIMSTDELLCIVQIHTISLKCGYCCDCCTIAVCLFDSSRWFECMTFNVRKHIARSKYHSPHFFNARQNPVPPESQSIFSYIHSLAELHLVPSTTLYLVYPSIRTKDANRRVICAPKDMRAVMISGTLSYVTSSHHTIFI